MKLHGNETAVVFSSKLLIKLGKYRLYKVKLRINSRYFLLDHNLYQVYTDGLKRVNNNFFVCIGRF